MTHSSETEDCARKTLTLLEKNGAKLATAESCTGGLIAACVTAIPGSSHGFEAGFVTYSNEAKTSMLGVPADLIATHGAVSQPVAEAMARGALERSHADISVAVTGIAGPEGGTPTKPVGLVHIAAATHDGRLVHAAPILPGDRDAVRTATVTTALRMVIDLLNTETT